MEASGSSCSLAALQETTGPDTGTDQDFAPLFCCGQWTNETAFRASAIAAMNLFQLA